MIDLIRKLLTKKPLYEFGVCNLLRARRNTKTGAVQMLLHEKGSQGRPDDYWHNFDKYWWHGFVRDEK